MRVRVQDWINGASVTLTLSEEKPLLSWCRFRRDEEGYTWIGITWMLEDGVISRDQNCESRDCDGLIQSSLCHEAKIEKHGMSFRSGEFHCVREEQRDFNAEAAGY